MTVVEKEKMEYVCLDCGHEWDLHVGILGIARCPNVNKPCRSYNVVPKSFPRMVEKAKELGINDDTPILDRRNAFNAVCEQEGLFSLGFREFRRVMRKVIGAAEEEAEGQKLARLLELWE